MGMMQDDIEPVHLDNLKFQKRHESLPASLIARITLIYYVFRPYVTASLEQTIDNFKYDQSPESEIEIWEQMSRVMVTLKDGDNWTDDKLHLATRDVLALSLGSTMESQLSDTEKNHILTLWHDRQPR